MAFSSLTTSAALCFRSAASLACAFTGSSKDSDVIDGDGRGAFELPFVVAGVETSECTEDEEEATESFSLVLPLTGLTAMCSLSVPRATSSLYIPSSSSLLLCASTCHITPRMTCGIPLAMAGAGDSCGAFVDDRLPQVPIHRLRDVSCRA
jgi:hypothetical protein